MDNESISELTANLVAIFGTELRGERVPQPNRARAAAAAGPTPGLNGGDRARWRKAKEEQAKAEARKQVYGEKPRDVFSGHQRPPAATPPPAPMSPSEVLEEIDGRTSKCHQDDVHLIRSLAANQKGILELNGAAIPVGSLVSTDNTKDLADVQAANRRLTRRVNSLENSRVGVGCAKAVAAAAALFLFVTLTLVSATLVLAYAEHSWDVPVFTRLFEGR
jgi:hypothetical protein